MNFIHTGLVTPLPLRIFTFSHRAAHVDVHLGGFGCGGGIGNIHSGGAWSAGYPAKQTKYSLCFSLNLSDQTSPNLDVVFG